MISFHEGWPDSALAFSAAVTFFDLVVEAFLVVVALAFVALVALVAVAAAAI